MIRGCPPDAPNLPGRSVPPHLELRDRLRRHEGERLLYAKVKRALARQQWSDMNYCAEAKTAVISAILRRAWALGGQIFFM